MGSKSDWPTMKFCTETLKKLQVKFDAKIISAHRSPDRMYAFAKSAEKENYSVIIAGAGGSAHLPGMIASMSTLPVIGVPIESKKLKGLDSLLSIVQMPKVFLWEQLPLERMELSMLESWQPPLLLLKIKKLKKT